MINAETGPKKVTTRPAERSSVVLEVEFPAAEVQRSVAESVLRRATVPVFLMRITESEAGRKAA